MSTTNDKFVPGPPDYNIAALDKKTEIRGTIGAAWKNADGSIRLKLNPFLVLDTGKNDLVVTLFPVNNRDQARYKKQDKAAQDVTQDSTPAF